jgi:phosphoenolpyruvate-protein kinase (PTS system EI component)
LADLDTLPGANNSTTTIPARMLGTAAKTLYRSLEVSFESNETLTHRVYFEVAVTITGWRVQVTKALAATDAGTINLQDSAGANITPNATLTIPLSTIIGTVYNQGAPTSANRVVAAGDYIQFVVLKTTPGGKARITISFTPN